MSRIDAVQLVIAAINGNCVGGGLEVALSADVRVARRGEYKLGFPKSTLDAVWAQKKPFKHLTIGLIGSALLLSEAFC